MTRRIFVVAVVLALAATSVTWFSRAEARVPRQPFSRFPLQVGQWKGHENPPFEAKLLRVLGVDDYINRTYVRGAWPVSLYAGYYETQRTGDTIHSPMKCLPGTGWQPLSTGVTTIEVPTSDGGIRPIRVNRYVVQKGSERYVVMFWYQAHGAVVTSEYVAKLRLMVDAVRINRTDGALVRVIVPIADGAPDTAADDTARDFVQAIFSELDHYLPV